MPPTGNFLRFSFQGVCYEYLILPFGLSLTLRVFVRCTEVAIAQLKKWGIRLAMYLDDLLLLAQSQQKAVTHTRVLVQHLWELAFIKKNRREEQALSCKGHGFSGLSSELFR